MDEQTGLDLTEQNVETVLDEIRPYLIGKLSMVFLYPCMTAACAEEAVFAFTGCTRLLCCNIGRHKNFWRKAV